MQGNCDEIKEGENFKTFILSQRHQKCQNRMKVKKANIDNLSNSTEILELQKAGRNAEDSCFNTERSCPNRL